MTSTAAADWVAAWERADHPAAEAVSWRDCPQEAEFRCGRMTVPVDWSRTDGETVEIAVRTLLSEKADAPVLFAIDGGPGGDGAGLLSGLAGEGANPAVVAAFTVATLTPRGVYGADGGGLPLNCPPQSDGCEESTSLQRYASTTDVALDFEYLRRVLGGQPFQAIGYSYGTYVAGVYATLFPAHAHRIVFDGAAVGFSFSPSGDERQQLAFEDTLDRFLHACVRGELGRCPFEGDQETAKKQLIALRAAVQAHPLGEGTASDDNAVDGHYLTGRVSQAFYGSRPGWPALARWLSEVAALAQTVETPAASGSASADTVGRPLLRPADGADDDFEVQARLAHAVECAMPNATNLPPRTSPLPLPGKDLFFVGDGTGPEDGEQRTRSCAVDRPVHLDPDLDASSREPFLVTSVTGDPATPFSDAATLADEIHAFLLPVDGEGHTSVFSTSTCSSGIALQYLTAGALPADGTRCATDS